MSSDRDFVTVTIKVTREDIAHVVRHFAGERPGRPTVAVQRLVSVDTRFIADMGPREPYCPHCGTDVPSDKED